MNTQKLNPAGNTAGNGDGGHEIFNATHRVGAEQVVTLIEQTLRKDVCMKRDENDLLDEDGMQVWSRGYRAGITTFHSALASILVVMRELQPRERKEFIEILKIVVDGCPNENDGTTCLHGHCDPAESQ